MKYVIPLFLLVVCMIFVSYWLVTPSLTWNRYVGTEITSHYFLPEYFYNISRFDGYVNDSESHCKWTTTVNVSGAVCAAYYDDRADPIGVKVLGYWSLYRDKTRFIYCDFKSRSDRLWTVEAHLTSITNFVHEKWEYHPNFFHCKFDNKTPNKTFPTEVRIRYANPNYSSEYQKLSSPWLQVHYMKRNAPPNKRRFSVCVEGPVFRNNPPIPLQLLVEFLKMTMILGAEFFTVYLNDPRPQIMATLQDYTNKGIVELVDWNVRTKLLFYRGQKAAINDCLYRNMYKTKYLVFLDIDELIVPKLDHNWTALMNRIDKDEKHAYFSFRNAFFHNEHQPLKQFSEQHKLPCSNISIPRYYTNWKRSKAAQPHGRRSKYIVKPETANITDVHFVKDLLAGFTVYEVEEEIGLMHHYRFPEMWPDEKTVVETRMLAYATELMNALNKTMCAGNEN